MKALDIMPRYNIVAFLLSVFEGVLDSFGVGVFQLQPGGDAAAEGGDFNFLLSDDRGECLAQNSLVVFGLRSERKSQNYF